MPLTVQSRSASSPQSLSFHDIARTVSRLAEQDKTVITVPDVARDLLGLYSNSRFARHRGEHRRQPGPQRVATTLGVDRVVAG